MTDVMVLGPQTIHDLARQTLAQFATSNPFEILAQMQAKCYERKMLGLRGYSVVFYDIPTVVLNSSLDDTSKLIVAAHELGHVILHKTILREGVLFEREDVKIGNNRTEHEADLFATELLISDQSILENIADCRDIYTLAGLLNVTPTLLNTKLLSMSKRGYDIVPPLPAISPMQDILVFD